MERSNLAWHRYRPDQPGPSVTGMEDFPSQPCRRHCRDGAFRGSDNLVPSSLGLLIMGHGRRQILWFGVTVSTPEELTQACGWEQIPRYLIRDRWSATDSSMTS